MATNAENLATRRTAIYTELAALATSTAGGLPNTTGPGTNVDHQGYKRGLYAELADIEKLLATIEGPYENYSLVDH